MSKRLQRLYIGDEREATISDLVGLSVEQLSALARFVDEFGFFGGDPKNIQDLALEIGLSFEKTVDVMQRAAHLETERVRFSLTPGDMLVEFAIYLERHDETALLKKLPEVSDALKELFHDRPQIAFRAKVANVTGGIVPQAIDFYSLCDLRPVFDDDRSQALEYVPIALVRVLVRSDVQDENSSLVFQLDKGGVARLEEFLERLKKKMNFLEKTRTELLERKN
jgi:hypothetical protein